MTPRSTRGATAADSPIEVARAGLAWTAASWLAICAPAESPPSTVRAGSPPNRPACEVAERLFISPHTVRGHLRHAFEKLGISSRVALSRLAVKHHEP